MNIKVFQPGPTHGTFFCTKEFEQACAELNISEWHAAVWIGRLFARNQDFGEHWFDNWDEREELENFSLIFPKDEDYSSLLIVVPRSFIQKSQSCWSCGEKIVKINCPNCQKELNIKPDGPVYSEEVVKSFWIDVCESLIVSRKTLELVAKKYERNYQEK